MDYLSAYATTLNLRVRYNTTVTAVDRAATGSDSSGFVVTDSAGGVYECAHVVVATGWTENAAPKGMVGVVHATSYGEMSLDRAEYKDKKVLIVGGDPPYWP